MFCSLGVALFARGKLTESLEGIETGRSLPSPALKIGGKLTESLEGIETKNRVNSDKFGVCGKLTESLEGIETNFKTTLGSLLEAANSLNP